MNPPNREVLIRLSRKLVPAHWSDKTLVAGEAFDFEWTDLGRTRLMQLDAILRELGPLDVRRHHISGGTSPDRPSSPGRCASATDQSPVGGPAPPRLSCA